MTVGIVLCFMNKQIVNDSWLIISVKQNLTDQFKKTGNKSQMICKRLKYINYSQI